MKAYVRWMMCRNYQVEHCLIPSDRRVADPDELLLLTKEEVVKVLCLFVMEVKDACGKDYNRDTLYDLVIMVQSFFKENGKLYKFLDDPDFFYLKNTLDNRMKQLSKEGKIAPRIKAMPISLEEEEMLWEKGILGDENPTKLVDTLLYLLGIHFALRAAKEHKDLKVDQQIKVMFDAEVALKYLYYEENTSKCNQGGLASRFVEGKKSRAYQNVVNSDRCVVRLYEKYISHRPSHLPRCSKDLYLRPLAVPNGDIWFSCQARGRHALEKVIKALCKQGGFTGKRMNHSCRATLATRLYDNGVDEQLICEKTGHRSIAVRSYKRTSNRQQRDLTSMIYGNNNAKQPKVELVAKTEPSATVSKAPESKECVNSDHKVEQQIVVKQGENSSSVELSKGITLNININLQK